MARETQITLFSGVPFDESNVLSQKSYGTPEAVLGFLSSFQVLQTSGDLTYQRNDMYARLPVTPAGRQGLDHATLFSCNYISWINPGRESRQMFGKVTHIEYRNEGCAWVHFKVDYWHSYIDTITNIKGFIEYSHYSNEIGWTRTALRQEDIDTAQMGSYYTHRIPFTTRGFSVTTILDNDGQLKTPLFWDTGTGEPKTSMTVVSTVSDLNAYLAQFVDHPEAIVCINMLAWAPEGEYEIPYPPDLGSQVPYPWTKSYKFPSMYLEVSDGLGQELILHPEYFVQGAFGTNQGVAPVKFQLDVDLESPYPSCNLTPLNYKGMAVNTNYRMVYDKYPRLPWVGDAFGQWLSTQWPSMITSGVNGAIMGGVAGSVAGPVGTVVGALVGAAGSIGTNVLTQLEKPDIVMNQSSFGGIANFRGDQIYPGFIIKCIGAQPGLMAANNKYWNMYGYKNGHVGTPNMDQHPHWNYVKGDFVFRCGCPMEGKQEIRTMFSRGIRFWHTGADDFGNFDLDNRA